MQNSNLTDPRRPINPMIKPKAVGAYTDEHGCRPSAGYTWCPKENRCVRIWELAKGMGISNNQARQYCKSTQPSQPHDQKIIIQQAASDASDKDKNFFEKHATLIYIAIGVIVLVIVLLLLFRRKPVQSRFSKSCPCSKARRGYK